MTEAGWVTGTFGVRTNTVSSPVGLNVEELMQLALRRNPRRAHLLVSTVLGKHLPVDPRLAAGMGRLLGALVGARLDELPVPTAWADAARQALSRGDFSGLDDLGPTAPRGLLVLGYAETATSLGHLVADQLAAAWYLHSTRRAVAGVASAGGFEESHSHATSHLLLPVPVDLLDQSGPLVLVDDEISTGRTALATIRELHGRTARQHYVIAALLDMRSPADRAAFAAVAGELGVQIDVVALASGEIELPEALPTAVSQRLAELPEAELPAGPTQPVRALELWWPGGVPDSGRHGVAREQRPHVERAVRFCAERIAGTIASDMPSTASILVLGTEEFMYVPLRIAEALNRALNAAKRTEQTAEQTLGQTTEQSAREHRVLFQSTTRSPVHPIDQHGYPIRRAFTFEASDSAASTIADDVLGRYVYNVRLPDGSDPDLVVLVADSGHDADLLSDGPAGALSRAGLSVLIVRISPDGLPEPLRGSNFGSYGDQEVGWLLTDLSDLDLEGDLAEREAKIQSGQAHYAESLPKEFLPAPEYQALFEDVLTETAGRLATATATVTELVLAERGPEVVFASLARAGTPVGILMRRWAQFRHGLDIPHYAMSIVRGRGIDKVALRYLADRYPPESVVFVDGWTGKGAIAKELTAALREYGEQTGVWFNGDLAVLADPGHCTRTYGTRDDFLIASACLNSTVSGLVSRTVLNPLYTNDSQFHGAKYYRDLAPADVSIRLLEKVSAHFPDVADSVTAAVAEVRAGDRAVTFAGWEAVERIRAEYGISSVNFVKPGVGETTRVLLRRIPWRILLRESDNPDHAHLRLLAQERGVPLDIRPDLPYSCIGLIKPLSADDRGEG